MSLVFQVELCQLEEHFLYVKLLTLMLKSLLGIFHYVYMHVWCGIILLFIASRAKEAITMPWLEALIRLLMLSCYQPCILLRKELFSWVSLSAFPCSLLYAFLRCSFSSLSFWICWNSLRSWCFSGGLLSRVSALTEAPRY